MKNEKQSSFLSRVYHIARQIPPGKVSTYKAIAHAAGSKAYRAIGQAMRHNPYAFAMCSDPDQRVPCHRVVASNGTIGGFMGKTNGEEIRKKIRLLQKEGVDIHRNKVVNFPRVFYSF